MNAKGGYCWHVYRQSVLVIEYNNNNDDGMFTGKNNMNQISRHQKMRKEEHVRSAPKVFWEDTDEQAREN
jgi:hypothetical protein